MSDDNQPANDRPMADDELLLSFLCEMEDRLQQSDDAAGSISSLIDSISSIDPDRHRKAQKALLLLQRARQNLAMFGKAGDQSGGKDEGQTESVALHGDSTHIGPPGTGDPLVENCIGRFQIERELGEGAFSKVFLARDPALDRQIALKVPRPGLLMDDTSRQRFQREARAAAVLSHPGIVPTFEAGAVGPLTYLAMGYCPGRTLAEWKSDREVPAREAARIVAKLALAVEHAHQRGILHRDLKPANILIEGTVDQPFNPDESIADLVRVTDFGLAKYESRSDSLTQEGTILGTPAYMSPEQAMAKSDIGPTTDVYALGTILYELLTGQVPFRGENQLATLRAVESELPKSPRAIKPTVPKNLEAICLKCLAKQPASRYSSAFELSEDLAAFLDNRPIVARQQTVWENVAGWAQRNSSLALVTSLAFLFLIVGLAGTSWQFMVARSNLDRAENAIEEERVARKQAEKVTGFLSKTYRSAKPEEEGREVKVIDMLDRATKEVNEEFRDDDETRWSLLGELANTYRGLGIFDVPVSLYQQVYDQRVEKGRFKEPETLSAMLGLAGSYNDQGMYEDARRVSDKALNLADDLGVRGTLRARSLTTQAVLLMQSGNREQAIEGFQDALSIYEASPTAEKRSVLNIKHKLAVCLRMNRQLEDAIRLLKKALPEATKEFGDEHPTTLDLLGEYTSALQAQGRFEEVIPMMQRHVETSERVYGAGHARTQQIKGNLASGLKDAGRFDESIGLYQEVVAAAEQSYGMDSTNTAIPRYLLANALRDASRIDEAEVCYREALPVMNKLLGPTSHWTKNCVLTLARLLRGCAKWEQAAEVWEHHARDFEPGAETHDALEWALCNLACGFSKIHAGDVDDGLKLIDTHLVASPGFPHPVLVRGHAQVIAALIGQSEFEKAVPFAEAYLRLSTDDPELTKDALFSRIQAAAIQVECEGQISGDPLAKVDLSVEFPFQKDDWFHVSDSLDILSSAVGAGVSDEHTKLVQELVRLRTESGYSFPFYKPSS